MTMLEILVQTAKKILVIDDNQDSAELLSMILAHWGHTTRAAFDGMAGLRLAAGFQPAVVFIDLGMPVLNGYEVAAAMRKIDGLQTAVLVAYTAWNDAATHKRVVLAGFNHHVTKPGDLDVIKMLVA